MRSILVRIPDSEAKAFDAIQARFPGVSLQVIMRATVLSAGRIGIVNALAKHAVDKAKGFK